MGGLLRLWVVVVGRMRAVVVEVVMAQEVVLVRVLVRWIALS